MNLLKETITAIEADNKDWRDQWGYYHTPKPCCVCISKHQIGQEPRYGYSVCQEHSVLSPTQINEQRTDVSN